MRHARERKGEGELKRGRVRGERKERRERERATYISCCQSSHLLLAKVKMGLLNVKLVKTCFLKKLVFTFTSY